MSANNNCADFTSSTPPSSTQGGGKKTGMDLSPSRYSTRAEVSISRPEPPNMAMSALPMRPTAPYSPRDVTIPERLSAAVPARSEPLGDRIQLPPLRDVSCCIPLSSYFADVPKIVPDFQFQGGQSEHQITRRSSPYGHARYNAAYTPPENAPSPSSNKRRRLTPDDDEAYLESREHVVPRLYQDPARLHHLSAPGRVSPVSSSRREGGYSNAESWNGLAKTSPYISSRGLPPITSPSQSYESSSLSRQGWRPKLPSLPTLPVTAPPQGRSQFSESSLESTRVGAQIYPPLHNSIFDAPTSPYYSTPGVSYGYQQPRGQSYSGPSGYSPSQDPIPFSSSGHFGIHHGAGFPTYGMESQEPADSKQRKRRGNLPKETTDKLRAWFVAHLQHPYPTEDEKQELMRQTGLQMSEHTFPTTSHLYRGLFCLVKKGNRKLTRESQIKSQIGSSMHGEGSCRQ